MSATNKDAWLLVTDGTNSFDAEVRAGALALARERGHLRIRLVSEDSLAARLRANPHFFEEGSYAVLSHVRRPEILRAIGQAQTPCVLLGEEAVDDWRQAHGGPIAVCSIDNKAIGQLAADYLHNLRPFAAYVYADLPAEQGTRWWSAPRAAAFVETLAEHGYTGKVPRFSFYAHAPRHESDEFLKLLAHLPRPIAVFACNDRIAAEVTTAATAGGLHVPDDVTVLGVDNDTAICETAATSLSSIKIEHQRLGRTAMGMLIRMLEGGARRAETIFCPPVRVVERDSTRRRTPADPHVARAVEFIAQARADLISVASVVKASGASRSYLENRYRDETGRTILAAIHERLLADVKRALLDTEDAIANIAQQVGFASASGLCSFFKRATGVSMRDYRATHRPPRTA